MLKSNDASEKLIGTTGFGDLSCTEEERTELLHLSGGGDAYAKRAVENAIMRFELDAMELILRMLREDQSDFLQDTRTIDTLHVNRCIVEMHRGAGVVPHGGNDVVANARFVLERYTTITTMKFEMMMIVDVAHHFIPLDWAAMRTDFAVIDHLIRERKDGFAIQLFDEIRIQSILCLQVFGQRFIFKEGHKTAPSPSA